MFSFGQRWFEQLIFNNVIGRPEVVFGINDLLAASSRIPTTVCTTNTDPWTHPLPYALDMDMEKDGGTGTQEGAADLRGAISALRQSTGR